ncbi:MAG: hypothetical protein WC565_04060 [Parcubacteria group bacterium]
MYTELFRDLIESRSEDWRKGYEDGLRGERDGWAVAINHEYRAGNDYARRIVEAGAGA